MGGPGSGRRPGVKGKPKSMPYKVASALKTASIKNMQPTRDSKGKIVAKSDLSIYKLRSFGNKMDSQMVRKGIGASWTGTTWVKGKKFKSKKINPLTPY